MELLLNIRSVAIRNVLLVVDQAYALFTLKSCLLAPRGI